ncbi:MAG: RdgB/HAM1 family non-canonical purine NTP pyrophosphatase [Acidobacteria bacterium]|nr:RdgB/HAM1 family non-canonical purine NTP pyrophosphatase [Acidobacteriota bacterium]
MKRVLLATSNPGKIRDFIGAARTRQIQIVTLPHFDTLPPVIENGTTFTANARKKARAYSRFAPHELVIADDSGLEVDALGGAPGVHSARYAQARPSASMTNTDDQANNAKLIDQIRQIAEERRTARFRCVIAAARDGVILGIFEGAADGMILDTPRGREGFGYDPLFYFPVLKKTFAELRADEKAQYSHRGQAFRKFLTWYEQV